MRHKCDECGSTNTTKTSDDVMYYSGQSHHCNNCDTEFTPDGYIDYRKSTLGSPTSLDRLSWETEADYRNRLGNMGIDPDNE